MKGQGYHPKNTAHLDVSTVGGNFNLVGGEGWSTSFDTALQPQWKASLLLLCGNKLSCQLQL